MGVEGFEFLKEFNQKRIFFMPYRLKLILIPLIVIMLFPLHSHAVESVDGGSGGFAHNMDDGQGVCRTCHDPPDPDKEKRIWTLPLNPTFAGIRQLCHSCHDGTRATSGVITVFDPDRIHPYGAEIEDHVMHDWAKVYGGKANSTGFGTIFPLDITDEHNFPKNKITGLPIPGDSPVENITSNGSDAGEGFYCGSCHDVHRQPRFNNIPVTDGNGNYLRIDSSKIETVEEFGTQGRRFKYCKQCHPDKLDGVYFGHGQESRKCLICHSVHWGATAISDDPIDKLIGQFILGYKPLTVNAPPNVSNLICTCKSDACHTQGLDDNYEHHPMGSGANLDPVTSHAPSAGNYTDYLTCNTCHDVHYNYAKFGFYNDFLSIEYSEVVGPFNGDTFYVHYLDPEMTENYWHYNGPDVVVTPSKFCLKCHSDKNETYKYIGAYTEWGHDWDCSTCHCVHYGYSIPYATLQTTDPGADKSNSAVSADLFMRYDLVNIIWNATQGPVNLTWSDKAGDTSLSDYEDVCWGCHARYIWSWPSYGLPHDPSFGVCQVESCHPGISSDSNSTHPVSAPDTWHSHPVNADALLANPNIIPGINNPFGDGPVLSDNISGLAAGPNPNNDYGVDYGRIYCGSCHNVHTNYYRSYLRCNNNIETRSISFICIRCHGNDTVALGCDTISPFDIGAGDDHPYNSPPKPNGPSPTKDQFPIFLTRASSEVYRLGGKTFNGQQDGGMVCETCHRAHNAEYHNGTTTKINVLPHDNPTDPDYICRQCHIYKPSENLLVVFDYPKTEPGYDMLVTNYQNDLKASGYAYNLWEIDIHGEIYGDVIGEILPQYKTIMWIALYNNCYWLAGSAIQEHLIGYLNNGGNLLVAGSGTACVKDSALYSDYLHSQYNGNFYSSGPFLLSGTEDDFLSHGMNLYLDQNNDLYADVIDPIYPGAEGEVEVLYTYEGYTGQGDGAAALKVTTPDYFIVYYAFDLDKIEGADNRKELLSRSLGWLTPEFFTLDPGFNMVSFHQGLEWSYLVDQNVPIVKIQTFQPETSNWLTLFPSDEVDFSYGRGWMVYINQQIPHAIELTFPYTSSALIFNPQEDLFPGMNLINFYALSQMLYIQYGQKLTWPKNVFQKLNQETGKDSVSILRYDRQEGRWQAKYTFFGHEAGLTTKLMKEGYVVYFQ